MAAAALVEVAEVAELEDLALKGITAAEATVGQDIKAIYLEQILLTATEEVVKVIVILMENLALTLGQHMATAVEEQDINEIGGTETNKHLAEAQELSL